MPLKLAGGLVALILACVGFQLFLRFEYIANGRGAVVRVDRLTGQSCNVYLCDYYWGLGPRTLNFVPDQTPPPLGLIPVKTPPPAPAPVDHEQTDANDWGADDPRTKPPAWLVTPRP